MTTDREVLVDQLSDWEEELQYVYRNGLPLDSRSLLRLVADCKAALTAQGGEQSAEMLAQRFHEAYERLAPQFGYVTRKETREFDKETSNGRLMIAVCDEIIRGHDRQALKKSAEMVPTDDYYWPKFSIILRKDLDGCCTVSIQRDNEKEQVVISDCHDIVHHAVHSPLIERALAMPIREAMLAAAKEGK